MKQAAAEIGRLLALLNKLWRRERDNERLFRIVGEALVQEAWKYPDFKTKLIDALDVAVTYEKDRRFLADHGWG